MYKRKRVITEGAQDLRESALFGLKLKLDVLSELTGIFEDDPDGVTQQQIQDMKQDIRDTLRSLAQEGTSLSDMYNRFGSLFFKSKILQSTDLVNKLSQNKEKSIIDLVNEDLLLERRLNAVNDPMAQQQRQYVMAKKTTGIAVQDPLLQQRQAMQQYMAQILAQRFGQGQGPQGGGQGPQPPQPPPPQGPQGRGQGPPRGGQGPQPPPRQPQGQGPQYPPQNAPRQQIPQRQTQASIPPAQQNDQDGDSYMQSPAPDQGTGFFIIPPNNPPPQAQQLSRKKPVRTRKTKSQIREASPPPMMQPGARAVHLTNVKNQMMEDISDRPEKTSAQDSEELKQMMGVLGQKIESDFSDIQLRSKSRPRSTSVPRLKPSPVQLKQQQQDPAKQREIDFNQMTRSLYNNDDNFQPTDRNIDMLNRYGELAVQIGSNDAVNHFYETLNHFFNQFIRTLNNQQDVPAMLLDRSGVVKQIEYQANQRIIDVPTAIQRLMNLDIDMMNQLEQQQQQVQQKRQIRQDREEEKKTINQSITDLMNSGQYKQVLMDLHDLEKQKKMSKGMHSQIVKNLLAKIPHSPALDHIQDELQKRDFRLNKSIYQHLLEMVDLKALDLTKQMLNTGNIKQAEQMAYDYFIDGQIANDDMSDLLNLIINSIPTNDFVTNAVEQYNQEIYSIDDLHSALQSYIDQQYLYGQASPIPLAQQPDEEMKSEEQKSEPRGRMLTRSKSQHVQQHSRSRSKSQTDMNRQERERIDNEIQNNFRQEQTRKQVLKDIVGGLDRFQVYDKARRTKQPISDDQRVPYLDPSTKDAYRIILKAVQSLPKTTQTQQQTRHDTLQQFNALYSDYIGRKKKVTSQQIQQLKQLLGSL